MLRDLPFALKIISMPVVAAIGFIAIAVTSLLAGSQLRAVSSQIQDGYVPALLLLRDLQSDLDDLQQGLQGAVAASDRQLLAETGTIRDAFLAKLQRADEISTIDPDRTRSLAESFTEYYDSARSTSQRMIDGEVGEGLLRSIEEMRSSYNQIRAALDTDAAQAREKMQQAFERSRDVYASARTTSLVVTLIAMVVLAGISWVVARYLSSALASTMASADRMAEGDLSQRLEVTGRDELGRTGQALDRLFVKIRDVMSSIGQDASQLAGSSEDLSRLSQEMSSNAEETSAQANVVSAASEQVNANVQTVAIAVEELTASVREIASNANDAASIASSAVERAESTNTTISKLGDSSAEIGKVINVITAIAEQTNLLALNATIEAARAGEAGKGFAVVANEVKELAKETSHATEEIRQRIAAIQDDSSQAIDAIAAISDIIESINEIQATIATAVEEQTATASEIGRNIAEAARGSSEIASSIAGVAEAAQSTSEAAASAMSAASGLAEMAARLRQSVDQFRQAGRAGGSA